MGEGLKRAKAAAKASRKPYTLGELTPSQAIEIRSLKGNLSQDKIAERFGISHSTVAKIHRGELWRA